MPTGMQVAGAWSWRIIGVVGVIAIVLWLIVQLRLLVIPVLVAVILSALLVPFKNFLVQHRWPRWAAIAAALLSTLAVVAGLLYLIVTEVTTGMGDLREKSVASFQQFTDFLATSPFAVSEADLEAAFNSILGAIQENSSALVSQVASLGGTVGHILTGVLLALFTSLFILIDGDRIWAWLVRLFPRRARQSLDGAGKKGWATLQAYVKVQILVATIDAIGIGVGAALLGVPLALPIAVLVFLGSFIPILGALVTGAIAVFIALVYNGWVIALILLGIVLLVQQVESHVLQPLIMGNAVQVHPLAVVLAVAAGSIVAGVAGAFFAVPVVATLNRMITHLAGQAQRRDRPELDQSTEKVTP